MENKDRHSNGTAVTDMHCEYNEYGDWDDQ